MKEGVKAGDNLFGYVDLSNLIAVNEHSLIKTEGPVILTPPTDLDTSLQNLETMITFALQYVINIIIHKVNYNTSFHYNL